MGGVSVPAGGQNQFAPKGEFAGGQNQFAPKGEFAGGKIKNQKKFYQQQVNLGTKNFDP